MRAKEGRGGPGVGADARELSSVSPQMVGFGGLGAEGPVLQEQWLPGEGTTTAAIASTNGYSRICVFSSTMSLR